MLNAQHSRLPPDGSTSVWIDVTQTAQVPMRAGIPRIVRGLHRELGGRLPVVAVQWLEWPGWYGLVSPRSPEGQRLASGGTRSRIGRAIEGLTRPARARRVQADSAFASGAVWLVPEPFWEGRAAYWASRPGTDTRRVSLFYDATPLSAGSEASPRRRARYADYLSALRAFDCVIAISRESRDDLLSFWQQRGQSGTTVLVEPLPCDFASQARHTDPNFGTGRILVVSTLDAHKNHLRLLEACNILWNQGVKFSVDLVGRSSGHAGQRVRAAIASLANAGRPVDWREQVGEAELLEAYRLCSFTAYPSLKEGFGLPILESLWHGRPCVCGSNGALGEVAAGGGCVTVDQNDPSRLAEGMRTLLADRTAYMRLYEESIRRRFRTWDNYADAVLSILVGSTVGKGSPN